MTAEPTRADSTPVAIVGAGPVGLALALGLARHGVRSTVLEQRATTSERSKAPAIQVRTREILRQWGVEDRFLQAGLLRRFIALHAADGRRGPHVSADFGHLEAEAHRPGMLILEQAETERLLLEAVRASGLCEVRFTARVVALRQRSDGVQVMVRRAGVDRPVHATFAVGCDGAGSFVRDALGLPFDGLTYSLRPMLADVRISDRRDLLPWPRLRNGPRGLTAALRLEPRLWRVIRIERGTASRSDEVPEPEVRGHVQQVIGAGPAEVVWASRFRIHRRSAPRFRQGRVLLAGDAAHVHSPVGGQGMNAGIQDAHNLAWKLAAALHGGDVERLLDSYDSERRAAVVDGVSAYTDLLTRVYLQTPRPVRTAGFAAARLLLAVPALRAMTLRRAAMLAVHYPPSALLDARVESAGARLPNPLLHHPGGAPARLYDLLPNGPALVEVTGGRPSSTEVPIDEVVRVGPDARTDPSGLLRRLLGGRDGWILVRPDRHVGWAGHHRERIAAAAAHALGTAT